MRQYKVTLLSDVIIQQSSATTGQNTTLDFIPGANFMGIAANKLYKEMGICEETYRIFHSGEVRFGDANPGIGTHRCSRVPLAMYHPKFNPVESECYIHHAIADFNALASIQLKQCRTGFYDFTDCTKATPVPIGKTLALKSARNKDTRSSKVGQLFCYQSLDKGSIFYFDIEAPAELEDKIEQALVGVRGLGRSRSAQYGSVMIEPSIFQGPECTPNETGEVVVYADSRLIFLDQYGLPTCQPKASDFGISDAGAYIDWSRSQIRQFSYSPWNYKRQCFDAELTGIKKGSVIIIKGATSSLSGRNTVGDYKTMGFGCVLYNPDFLAAQPDGNGRGKVVFSSHISEETVPERLADTPLVKYLQSRKSAEEIILETFRVVNSWVRKNGGNFCSIQMSSQWGQIRSLAMEGGSKDEIREKINDYLSHGVAKPRWDKFSRRNELLAFIDNELNEENVQMGIINLASEMAKKK